MRVAIHRPSELAPAELERWRALARAQGLDSPFLTPEFALAVDSVWGSTRVAVVYDGPDLVGFLPYNAGRFRTATPIADDFCNVQAYIGSGAPFTISEVIRAAPRAALRRAPFIEGWMRSSGQKIHRAFTFASMMRGYFCNSRSWAATSAGFHWLPR